MKLNAARNRTLRLILAGLLWAVVALTLPRGFGWLVELVAGYDVAAFFVLAMTWLFAVKGDPEMAQARASLQDPGRWAALAVVLLCVIVGLASAIAIVAHGPHATNPVERAVSYGLGISAVVLGWLLIHTMFLFRYAHLYYFDEDENDQMDRGIRFPGTDMPSDYDFAYFSYVIGMTFQVSDVVVVNPGVRRLVLFHGLISYAYNTAIFALAINVLAGLFH